MAIKKEIKEDVLLTAIKGSKGIVQTIAKILNIEWHTAKRLIDTSEKAKQLMDDEREINIDIAEKVILDAVNLDDVQTAKWYLQTIGKQRGYVEKQEVEHSGDIKIVEIPERKE